jgi:hypothetical protein
VLTPFSPHQTPIVKVEKGVETFIHDEDHVSTAPAVTAVRPAPWDEFFASE